MVFIKMHQNYRSGGVRVCITVYPLILFIVKSLRAYIIVVTVAGSLTCKVLLHCALLYYTYTQLLLGKIENALTASHRQNAF